MGNMHQLLAYLSSIPQGPIADGGPLESLLASAWHDFRGANAEGMKAYKLRGRMENIFWEPPVLSFMLERHGATFLGSTRAKLQYWQVNVETREATCRTDGHRQLVPMQPRLNVKPLAEEIAHLITEGRNDNRLKWNADGSVRVLIGKILPDDSAVQQTLQGRRKRFRTELKQLLVMRGWREVRLNVYERAPS
jgi:hypothetical protein